MPYSPLISKIRVHNPNKKGSSNANRNYVTYIATREGVSLEKVKNLSDLLNIEGMEQRVGAEAIVHEDAGNEQYLRYISKRPRSQGLFGNINTDDLTTVSSDIAKLTKSGRIIFRGVISLSEKDGEELGFRNVNAWNNYLKEVMPDVAQKLGISSVDHTWVAAFHAEEKHPHVHYMLWDNKDRVKSPFIHKVTQQKIRIFLEERMFNNEYDKVINQVYKEELKIIYKDKNKERAYLPEKAAELIKEIGYVPGAEYERLPQRAPKGYLEEVAKEVEQLIKLVPERGGIEYGYLPPEGKEQFEKVVDKLFERPDMESSLERYLDAVKQIGKYKGRTETKIARAIDREKNEVRKRIGNRILDELKVVVFVDDEKKTEILGDLKVDMLHEAAIENVDMDTFAENSKYKAEPAETIWNEEMNSFDNRSDPNHEIEPADIMYKVGCIYGDCKDPEYYDLKKAIGYLEESAVQENQFAQYKLGCIYADREEPELYDIEKAIGYWETSAEQGNQYAQYKLGCIYANTQSPYIDMEKSIKYLNESAEQENQFAQYKLGKIYADPNLVYYNLNRSIQFLNKSAKQENQFAQYELGKIYADKVSPYYNIDVAIRNFTLASEQGNEYAQCRLGCIFYFGKDVLRDKDLGRYWLECSATQGNEFAKSILEDQIVGIDFSYCLLKGALNSMETMNRQMDFSKNEVMKKMQSKQALKEKYLHQHKDQEE